METRKKSKLNKIEKKSLYVLLCAAALVSCGQPKQQQKAVADVVTSGNPIFEGWYADPEGIIYGDTYWVSHLERCV